MKRFVSAAAALFFSLSLSSVASARMMSGAMKEKMTKGGMEAMTMIQNRKVTVRKTARTIHEDKLKANREHPYAARGWMAHKASSAASSTATSASSSSAASSAH